jgi:hypothetical protein
MDPGGRTRWQAAGRSARNLRPAVGGVYFAQGFEWALVKGADGRSASDLVPVVRIGLTAPAMA